MLYIKAAPKDVQRCKETAARLRALRTNEPPCKPGEVWSMRTLATWRLPKRFMVIAVYRDMSEHARDVVLWSVEAVSMDPEYGECLAHLTGGAIERWGTKES